MKLTILGATGRTGRHVIEQALDGGHTVVAFARTPGKLDIEHEALSVVQGDIFEPDAVSEAVAGSDAIISVLGPTSNKPTYTISRGIEHVLDAMKEHGVKRLVQSVGAGVRFSQDEPGLLDRIIGFLLILFSRYVYEDMVRTATKIAASDRDWTLVRVPMLTDAEPRGDVKVGYLGQGTGPRVSRADMARFVLRIVEEGSYVHEAPVISN
jgi:nucleoside-diphosphate-sugar epimerase